VNIKEYISSGIVESYVLGLADEAERVEFEQFCTLYPEVRAARDAFEVQLEAQCMDAAAAPPALLRENILGQLTGLATTAQPAPVADLTPAPPAKARIFFMPARVAAAAAVVLLAGSAVLNYYYFNKYREYSARYSQLVAQQTEMARANNVMQTRLNSYETTLADITNPNMSVIKMAANAVPNNGSPDPASVATVYWNTLSKDVYLMLNNMPQPVAGKQYQLWAIVDGKPVDAGVVDMAAGASFVKLKNIPRAQLFAVTLEQQGGSPTPQGPMYVLGKV
jgi:anti-sigma-K factor RskA